MSCLRQLARMMLVWRIAKAHKLCAALFLGVGSLLHLRGTKNSFLLDLGAFCSELEL